MTARLALLDVVLEHGGDRVLDGVSLAIPEGEIVALVGASGAGKSSVVRAILGLTVPSRGTVEIAGRVASRDGRTILAPEERGLAVVFQDLALWPHMTVRGNVAFALEARRVPRDARVRKVDAILADVGLEGRGDRYPRELSGGERQRVALARALVVEPAAVLLDEPLANVDVLLKRELVALVGRTLHARSTTALYVTHDPEEARVLADRVVVLDAGRVVQQGTWAELSAAPASALVKALTANTRE